MYSIAKLDTSQIFFLNNQYMIFDSINPTIIYYSEKYKIIDDILLFKGIKLDAIKMCLIPHNSEPNRLEYEKPPESTEISDDVYELIKPYFITCIE